MARITSVAALQSAAAESTSEAWLTLIRVKSSTGTVLLRLCFNTQAIESNGETYTPMFADIQISERDGTRPTTATLVVDAVDRTVLSALSSITARPLVDVDFILSSDPDNPIDGLTDLELSGFQLSGGSRISANLEGPQYFDEMVPGVLMDPVNTPGLFP